jgi:hypothetical protein
VLDSRNFIVRTLLADGLITEADLRRATEHAMGTGGDLLDSMVSLGIATTRRLAIAKATGAFGCGYGLNKKPEDRCPVDSLLQKFQRSLVTSEVRSRGFQQLRDYSRSG